MRYFILLLAILMMATVGCNHGDNPERSYCFVATPFFGTECPDYWMLERDGERYFILDEDMTDEPRRREWRQNGRPDDGVGVDVSSDELYNGGLTTPTVRVGLTDDVLACLTYSYIYEVMLPTEWFDADGTCIEWPTPPREPPEVPGHDHPHDHPLPDHDHDWDHDHPFPDHDHDWPDHDHDHDHDDDCDDDDDDDRGHGNDCDRDDEDNPGRRRK